MKKLFVASMVIGLLVSVDTYALNTRNLGAMLVTKCPAGTYTKKFTGENERGGECLPCTGDTYSSTPGSTKCQPCPSGLKPNEEHTKCEISLVGLEDDVTVLANSVFLSACPANAECNSNGDFNCNDGYYKKSGGTKTCTKCPAGYECNHNKRTKCLAGEYSAAGSGKCLTCQADTYSTEGARKCRTCPKGKKANEDHTACVKA